jgi:hypothetical protein
MHSRRNGPERILVSTRSITAYRLVVPGTGTLRPKRGGSRLRAGEFENRRAAACGARTCAMEEPLRVKAIRDGPAKLALPLNGATRSLAPDRLVPSQGARSQGSEVASSDAFRWPPRDDGAPESRPAEETDPKRRPPVRTWRYGRISPCEDHRRRAGGGIHGPGAGRGDRGADFDPQGARDREKPGHGPGGRGSSLLPGHLRQLRAPPFRPLPQARRVSPRPRAGPALHAPAGRL